MDICSDYYELSQPQKSIWYLEQKYPDTCMNVIAGTIRFKEQLDYAILEEAIQLVIKNNDGLRIHFRDKEGEGSQYLTPYKKKKLDFVDFSLGNKLDDLFVWDEEQTKIPFKIIDSDLFFFAILKIDDNNCGIYAKLHHLISDAWTMSVAGNQVVAYYSAIKNGVPFEDVIKPSFLEHLTSEHKYEESDRFVRDREYWNNKFDIFPEPTILKPQALTTENIHSNRKTFVTPQKLSNKIRSFCNENNASVFMLFLSALSIYIHRVTGTEDIILGTTILNRVNAREKDTIGMFVSVAAPIRIQMSDSQNFTEFSNGMLKESISILKHQKYPYNYLIRDLKKKHKLNNRLFDIVLNYQNTKFATKKSDVEYITRWHFSGYQVESLVIHVNDRDDEGKFIIDYDFLTDIYNIKDIEYIHQHVINILWHALDNPLRPISLLEMLSEKEKHQILFDFNNTAADFPRDMTLHEFLYAQAEKTPDNIAVIYKENHMTYREINEKSNQLAQVLRKRGVKADTVVGLSVFRSFEMIIGIMGILKAGGAYLPMDPAYPQDRIEYMMHNSGSQILLTQAAIMDRFTFETVIINIEDPDIYIGDTSNLSINSGPTNLAYIIYTSGSTGNPKGVMVEHAGVINRLNWGSKKYPINESDIMLQKTPFTFDVSVWELFWWSFVGASVCMLEPGGEKDPESILKTVETNRITLIHFVPSMLNVFLSYVEMRAYADRLSTVKKYFSSGEALTVRLTDTFNRLLNKHYGAELFNLYGPTEATVEVSYFDCSPKVTLKTVPIGKPIDNIHLYVMDNNMNLLPIGIPGELYIGGIGVARGYINNPGLTAEKFLPDPFFPGERLYKTGDRVRWFPKGDIEYMGRIDFQIKIRGFRIELGEIESHLLLHSAIKDAVVVGRTHNSNSYLCAYYTIKKKVQVSAIKEHLAKDLPDYMIPAFFVVLDDLPLSTNGKADRQALPEPDFSHFSEEEYYGPENETEAALEKIWCNILRFEKVSVTESFFHIGGDSLYAIALITEVHKKFDVEMPVSEVFRLKTIRGISGYIINSIKKQYTPIPMIEKKSSYVMSSAQRRLFVLNKLEENDISYNLPGIMRIEGQIDKKKLEYAFKVLINRNESLRTSFVLEDGNPVQKVLADIDFSVDYITAPDRDYNEIIKNFIRPFDLSNPPLLRVSLLSLESGNQFLLFDMHHIISDGSSVNILIRDLSALYSSKELPKLKTQYKDYSVWQMNMLSEKRIKDMKKYWTEQFSGETPILNMPVDFPRPTRKSFKGGRTSYSLNKEISFNLKKLSWNTDTTLYMVMLSAYTVLLSKYAAQDDVIVGMPIEGRLNPDVRELIGMFVNTVAIRNYPQSDKPFLQFLQEVKINLLSAYENQEYPFEDLVDNIKIKRDLGRNPLFDMVFILQNMDLSNVNLDDAKLTTCAIDSGTSKFDITLEAFDRGDFIELTAEYCTDLFKESTIYRLLSHYSNILENVIKDPGKAISDIDMLSFEEKHMLAVDLNHTDAAFPGGKLLHQLFEEQVSKTPDQIAVKYESESLTYSELNMQANQLARMIRERGIGPDDIVGICVRRSIDMIVSMIAVLKAGGAYLPMDPDYPVERNLYILHDSAAKILLTQEEFVALWQDKVDVISLHDTEILEKDTGNLDLINGSNDLAYIIYTSGSTGKPKGVMIEHSNVVRLLFNDKFQFSFSSDDVWTMFHSYCFDFSVWEMYGALLYGGKLIIISKDSAKDTKKFVDIINEEKVTVLNQTPGAFNNFIQEDAVSSFAASSLRYVIFGGEALKPIALKPFYEKYPKTKLINMYGITETTVHVTYKEIGKEEIEKNISNIGKPIPTLRTYIVDKNLNLLPIGVPGELCVSGAGVGRGYINNDEYTCQKFIPNPFHTGERLYRSGDLARIGVDGDIEYMGRIDNQVKIRGYRIELGEIESELLKHRKIRETVVVPRENLSGEKKLYAYYVSDEKISNEELRIEMKNHLPDYMIPALFVHLAKMPLNKNGKIDKDILPQRDEAVEQIGFVEARNSTEKMIADVWSTVLELSRVGVTENFFDLGGDSLSAIKVISKLNEMKCMITLVDLYNNPTSEQLADMVLSESEPESDKLLICLTKTRKNCSVNVICFPYGGGTAISYKPLGDAISEISENHSLFAVNIPGHDIGGSDNLLSVEEVSQMVYQEIKNGIRGKIVLYGHCVGNAMLVETARLLEKDNIGIELVIFGAIFPPRFVRVYGNFIDPWMLRSDLKIISYLNGLGLPKTSLNNEYAGFIIRAFRHDARSFYRYFYKKSIQKPPLIKAACLCVVGENDAITKRHIRKYKGWDTCCKNIELFVIPKADHYFINSHAKELAGIINGKIESLNM